MAAPDYAYRNEKKLIAALGAANGDIAFSIDIFIARFLQNTTTDLGDGYFNESDDIAIKISKIKSLFKIDGFVIAASSGKNGFVGYCNINGANMIYHNENRLCNLLLSNNTYPSELRFLNDSGLNRRPDIPYFLTHLGVNTRINIINNSIFLHAYFKSSFWNKTLGVYIIAADSEYLSDKVDSNNLGEIDQNSVQEFNDNEVIFPDTFIFRVGRTYVVSLKAQNEEGAILSSSYLSLSPSPGIVTLRYGQTLNDAIISQGASTVYVSRKISNATVSGNVIFYSNLSATLFVPTGYYLSINADENGYYKYFRVTDNSGHVTEIGNIKASRHQDIYYYYSTISAGEAITHAPVQRVLYYEVILTPPGSDFENRQYYDGPFDISAIVSQGYYVKDDRLTSIYIDEDGNTSLLVN